MSYDTLLPGYHFVQASASDTWTIVHNLGTIAPAVDVWIDVSGTITKLMPSSVTAVSNTTVVLTFSTAYAGEAFVI